tara:strand:+ start:7813 stop:9111 length:1299 start_codon:yes stop_codon:yes gene_type:complete
MNIKHSSKLSAITLTIITSFSAQADQVILDDLIVDGSICVGQDCVNGESFGFDTLRLKENNLRIRAIDTSTTSSFPTRDWQITFNDSINGGLNKFSIDDIDGGRTPFTLEAGAPSHSLYVDDGGRLGLGTSTPVVDIHVKSGNTPTLRLEQDGSSGFGAQTWDVAGNEANFFIRDASNGSTLPFKIMPGAATNTLVVAASGNVGIGDQTPDAALDIESGDLLITDGKQIINSSATNGDTGNYALTLNNSNNTAATAFMMELENAGASYITFTDNSIINSVSAHQNWQISNYQGDFNITNALNGGHELVLEQGGDLRILGDVYANGVAITSSKHTKENFEPINNKNILEKVANLDLLKWNYITNSDDVKHIGPMAEDFHKTFSLNGSVTDKISISDLAGVSLASITALKEIVDNQLIQIKLLTQKVTSLEKKP